MIQIILDSLIRASELALIGVGLTMVYDILRFASFAHVQFGTIGAFVALSISLALPLPAAWAILVGALVACVITGGLGVLSDKLIFARLRNRPAAILMIASFGLGMVMQYGVQAIWGAGAHAYPLPLARPWIVFGGRLSPAGAGVIAAAAVSMLAFHLLLTRTKLGVAMRATADNPQLSEASGITTERIIRIVWFIGAALGALGGIMLGLVAQIQSNMGFEIMVAVFAAVIVGGIGNVHGAVLGAGVVAFAENIGLVINWAPLGRLLGLTTEAHLYIPVGFKTGITFVILILILLVMPRGILGRRA
ncbi:branched-chain amino acid ABC transporter permease [Castellaniella hirudinis]|uniref:branched-chain amino acid ABC transporter permease n=1 Tax=Castellaniella hirudinis TaxID=1144617 RepID=UPI0039C2A60A